MSICLGRSLALIMITMISLSAFHVLVGAEPISYDVSHSDPASDVEWTFPNGTKELRDEPKDLNLKWIVSTDKGDTVEIRLEVVNPGKIMTVPNATYSAYIATINKTTANLRIDFNVDTCKVWRIDGNETLVQSDVTCAIMPGSKQGREGEAVLFTVPKTLFVDPLVFEIAGQVTYIEDVEGIGNVTYTDYVWSLTGNPGSTPEEPPDNGDDGDDVFPFWAILAMIAVIVILILFIMLYLENRKRR